MVKSTDSGGKNSYLPVTASSSRGGTGSGRDGSMKNSNLHDIMLKLLQATSADEGSTTPTPPLSIPMLLNQRSHKRRKLNGWDDNRGSDSADSAGKGKGEQRVPATHTDGQDGTAAEDNVNEADGVPAKASEETVAATLSPPASSLAYYKNMLEAAVREDRQQREDFETSYRKKLRELRKVYLYGLGRVSTLQDLREAPDAILPGNFVVDDPRPPAEPERPRK